MKNLEQLIEALKTDENLRTKLVAAGDNEDACEAILAEEGYAVKAADLRDYAESCAQEEPDEEQLREVAGGSDSSDIIIEIEEQACSVLGCGIFGAGAACWA